VTKQAQTCTDQDVALT